MMHKLLVTGGAGFIGSEFVRQAVKRGYAVSVVDALSYAGDMARIEKVEKKLTFYKANIGDVDFIRHIFQAEKPDAVIHWAAESHVDRSILDATPFLETNIKGTRNLLEASRHYDVKRFINISTDEVYGELEAGGQFHETTPLNPNSPYSVTKASADMLGRAYFRTYGVPVITVRPSNNYGPWQYPEKLIPVVILKAMRGENIPVYGKGENIREWLFVSDCAGAVFSVLEHGDPGDIFNVGSGEEKRNIEVVRKILSLMGRQEKLIEFVKDRPGHDYRYFLDSTKVKKQLGWKRLVSFEKGIESTIQWYANNMTWVEKKAGNR
ncbi:MAG: dTDP-glucose 4,6-dehydratase [Dissulfurispiraceae bacterium]